MTGIEDTADAGSASDAGDALHTLERLRRHLQLTKEDLPGAPVPAPAETPPTE